MSIKNAYPELPVLKYERTAVTLSDVVVYIKSLLLPIPIKAAMYTMFRFESANGTKGVNNNYTGIQADGNRWADRFTPDMSGTISMQENGQNGVPGKVRIFIGFKTFEGCINMLADRVQARGLYIGGITHKVVRIRIDTPEDFVVAYKREWVTGNPHYIPTESEMKNIAGTYRQGVALFS